ncbi:1,3(4)-beta-glucanase [Zychaea mexicana]|uniref:1,3(4)-beta-glucanase n=1 Tax=Zychaea mexicana TaxID=64656 RepID=UPI0022FDE55B|nr:1,3(4)-beta-glucanase [Zychaea mexicana]KAI9493516.1 1,3(4)-beta-glucanase [Zychaea mexicana]
MLLAIDTRTIISIMSKNNNTTKMVRQEQHISTTTTIIMAPTRDVHQGSTFFDGFKFFSEPDPTHGFVHYVDKATAESNKLIQVQHRDDNAIIIKADNHTVIAPDDDIVGRSSVRIISNEAYDSGLFVFDVYHMPIGCGTWPALWLLGPDWPHGGEIDIVEGVNRQTRNLMTLHTSTGCMQRPHAIQRGKTITDDCDVNAADQEQNQGCSVQDRSKRSFGTGFNQHGGGVFAVQWMPMTGIQIWFFERDHIPRDIKAGSHPDPRTWGTPSANFPFDQHFCSATRFRKLNIIINTTFCGDWAGNPKIYHASRCPGDCVEFVRNNPEKFDEAYWRIKNIKVYTALFFH